MRFLTRGVWVVLDCLHVADPLLRASARDSLRKTPEVRHLMFGDMKFKNDNQLMMEFMSLYEYSMRKGRRIPQRLIPRALEIMEEEFLAHLKVMRMS